MPRYGTTHWKKPGYAPEPEHPDHWRTMCGETVWTGYRSEVTDDPSKVTCGACDSALAKIAMGRLFRAGA